jgi:hypothetical protein
LRLDPAPGGPLQLALPAVGTDQTEGSIRFYGRRPIGQDTDLPTFLADEGILFTQVRREAGRESVSVLAVAEVGERAFIVRVGPFEAALVHGDPLYNGVRPHGLYWSDESWDYTILADLPAEALVNLARNSVCRRS